MEGEKLSFSEEALLQAWQAQWGLAEAVLWEWKTVDVPV